MNATEVERKEATKRRIYRSSVPEMIFAHSNTARASDTGDFEKIQNKRKTKENVRALSSLVSRGEARTTRPVRSPLWLSVIVSQKHERSVCSYLEKSARGRRRRPRRRRRRRNPLSLWLPFSENTFSYF